MSRGSQASIDLIRRSIHLYHLMKLIPRNWVWVEERLDIEFPEARTRWPDAICRGTPTISDSLVVTRFADGSRTLNTPSSDVVATLFRLDYCLTLLGERLRTINGTRDGVFILVEGKRSRHGSGANQPMVTRCTTCDGAGKENRRPRLGVARKPAVDR